MDIVIGERHRLHVCFQAALKSVSRNKPLMGKLIAAVLLDWKRWQHQMCSWKWSTNSLSPRVYLLLLTTENFFLAVNRWCKDASLPPRCLFATFSFSSGWSGRSSAASGGVLLLVDRNVFVSAWTAARVPSPSGWVFVTGSDNNLT